MTSLELRRDLARVIRRVRPQRVLCPSPERNWQRVFASHPDHLAAGEASMAAVYPDARNRWVDITDVLPRKLDALRTHVSQHTDADDKLEERMRGWGALVAQEAGSADGRLAESFFAIDSAG